MAEEKCLTIFKNETFGSIQVIDREGEPWFVAKDVADILGYSETARMTTRLDEDEMSKIASTDLVGANVSAMARDLTIINESGLYNAVIGSKKPEAKAFRKWVTGEVIPSIRKTGTYTIQTSAKDHGLEWMKSQLKAATEIAGIFGLEGNMALLAANNLVKNTYHTDCLKQMEITHLETKFTTQYMTPSELGSQVNMTAQKMNKKLEELGLQKQVRTGNRLKWLVTEKGKGFCQLLDTNKRHADGALVIQVKWSTDILTDIVGEIP